MWDGRMNNCKNTNQEHKHSSMLSQEMSPAHKHITITSHNHIRLITKIFEILVGHVNRLMCHLFPYPRDQSGGEPMAFLARPTTCQL